MEILRTPDERFEDLPDLPFKRRSVEVPDGTGGRSGTIRLGYVEAGPAGSAPVLLLHGEPTWSYLYRHMTPVLADAGHRVIAADLVGFGRSDKPAAVSDHTYARHVAWTAAFIAALDLRDITLVAQDWGGLIGLRLVADRTDRFARVVAANTALPTGDQEMPRVWHAFRRAIREAEHLSISRLVQAGTTTELPRDVLAAYDAPFPEERFKAGPRALPELVPHQPDDPASDENRAAWRRLRRLQLPFLTAFSDRDPITAGADRLFQHRIPGAEGQPHTIIEGAGHFLQEDRGVELAEVVAAFIAES